MFRHTTFWIEMNFFQAFEPKSLNEPGAFWNISSYEFIPVLSFGNIKNICIPTINDEFFFYSYFLMLLTIGRVL